MSDANETGTTRSRFGNVVNLKDTPTHRWEDPGGRYGATGHEIAPMVGTQDLGFSVISIDAGKRSCPFHFHHLEEELFFVLDGTAVLRQGTPEGEEEIELRQGDFVSFPPGTGIAHQFINNSDEPFTYLAMSNRIKGDVAEYPDSDKLLLRSTRLMVRRSPKLDYFDGEA